MSGTGKSSVTRELVARGYKAVDTDDGWSEPQPDGRQSWREDAIQALLMTEDADVWFVVGCEENQNRFLPQFDKLVARLEDLGATGVREVNKGPAGHWWVMQDPEGNEFCVA